jgi:hypothetical protein
MVHARVFLRLVAALGGGYGVASLAVSVAVALLVRCGLAGAEAVVTAAMSGFVLYLAILLWGLGCESVARLYCGLGAAAAVLCGVWWAAR